MSHFVADKVDPSPAEDAGQDHLNRPRRIIPPHARRMPASHLVADQVSPSTAGDSANAHRHRARFLLLTLDPELSYVVAAWLEPQLEKIMIQCAIHVPN